MTLKKKEATEWGWEGFEEGKGEMLMIILQILPLEKELLQN